MADVVLKVDEIAKRFGKYTVLDKLSFDVYSGEIFGIIGSSGSGKTTLLSTLIGALPPSEGEVLFRAMHLLSYESDKESINKFRSVIRHHNEVKRLFGFASQEPSFYGDLTTQENLNLFGTLYGLSKDAKETNALILLKLMGLWEFRNVLSKNLSGGMQKRLDIACSLIHDPATLILDEPTSDLDPHLRAQMWDLIRKINNKGTTIILSSHFLDELENICDRIGILYKGNFAHVGTPAELKRLVAPHNEIHVQTLKGEYDKYLEDLKPQKHYHISFSLNKGSELELQSSSPQMVVDRLMQSIKEQGDVLIDLHVNEPTLNQVFENLMLKQYEPKKEESKKQEKKESKKGKKKFRKKGKKK